MMRVLLLQDRVTSNNWGGVQTMTHTLQLALQEQGFAVTALAWQETKFGELLHAARQSDVLVASHNFGPTYCGVALKTLARKPLVSWVQAFAGCFADVKGFLVEVSVVEACVWVCGSVCLCVAHY